MDSGPESGIRMIWILLFLTVFFAGCADEKPPRNSRVIAEINGFILTRNEFESKLARELAYNRQYKATDEAKTEFLESLIKKEVLIQEAVRQGMDKETLFTEAIERYWEATLIKNLMESRMRVLRETVIVSENEIKKRYQSLKMQNPALPPLVEIESDISAQVKEEKLTAAVEHWVTGLKQSADIKINPSNL